MSGRAGAGTFIVYMGFVGVSGLVGLIGTGIGSLIFDFGP